LLGICKTGIFAHRQIAADVCQRASCRLPEMAVLECLYAIKYEACEFLKSFHKRELASFSGHAAASVLVSSSPMAHPWPICGPRMAHPDFQVAGRMCQVTIGPWPIVPPLTTVAASSSHHTPAQPNQVSINADCSRGCWI
jgi:hypothetical protein